MSKPAGAWTAIGAVVVFVLGGLFLARLGREPRAPALEPPSPVLPASGGHAELLLRPDRTDSRPPAPVVEPREAQPERPPRETADRSGAGPVLGRIVGLVVDTEGVAVPGASVRMHRPALLVGTDSSGRFEIAELEPDSYQLEVLAEGLPSGLVPARNMGWPALTEVEIPATGGAVKVTLEVAEGASLSGRVLGPAGEPAQGFAVRVRRLGPERLTTDGGTDAEGRFRFEALWPGEYELQAWARPESELHRLPRPSQLFALAPGEELVLSDIVFELGPCAIRGRVIDQDERPVGGIAIVCERSVTATEADGSFLLDGLIPGSYGLWIGPGGYTGYRTIFANPQWWVSVKADLSSAAPVLDLGTIQIERDRLFEVAGRIEVATQAFELRDLALMVESVVRDQRLQRKPPERVRYDVETGAFGACFLPDGNVQELVFVVLHGRTELARVPVRVVADESIELVIPVR